MTRITNKHLLPVYDRPMVTYPIESLVRAGVTEAMLVTGGTHAGEFLRLLGNGHEWGLDRLLYAYQERPGGIAEALGLAERFADGDKVVVVLADNVFERSIAQSVERFERQDAGARVLLAEARRPRAPASPRRPRDRRRPHPQHRREAPGPSEPVRGDGRLLLRRVGLRGAPDARTVERAASSRSPT